MATACLFILLLICFVFLLLEKVKKCLTLFFITLVCFFALGNGFVPSYLLSQLQTPFLHIDNIEWKKRNAIVLLGAGATTLQNTQTILPTVMAYSRIDVAASLYYLCKKTKSDCKVIITGGDALKTGKSEAEVYRETLLNLHIPNKDMIVETNSLNTFKNAEYTSEIIRKNKFDTIFLVTSGIHLKRSLLYFSHFNIQAQPILAGYLETKLSWLPTGYNLALTDFALHEYLGIARFYIYNFFGLNKNITASGAS